MMYKNQFVCCVKANGKILREFKDEIKIPFGTEFSILLKNLSNVRAAATIYIDGQDVAPGNSFVINPKDQTEITRFIANGNIAQGNRFKFIERTSGIEQHRGIKMEDGLIRIEFQFEKQKPLVCDTHEHHHHHHHHHHHYDNSYQPTPWIGTPYKPNTLYQTRGGGSISDNAPNGLNISSSTSATISQKTLGIAPTSHETMNFMDFGQERGIVPNDVGITVPGSISNQRFNNISPFELETQVHTIIFKLSGTNDTGSVISKPYNVKTNVKCTTCGKVNKATAKFCSECGTSLTLI